ncbi:methyl-accepting chemotaxis protein [Marinagarivorans cellulosilyticus]|uniref:Twitching motility protein PilJ n=1 Tax=Marinagarivorans cellulosilyticus TaxID=2721545 RepID=A0AAN1WIX4_9GAMM|nr:HAMP domain-containing methyl-accepting chemotaxis protein [Marinagarivorans cellulosilyticus]BCD98390.1 twitching motility protein PilJ [Marinagarivorans cellulosilyticus]
MNFLFNLRISQKIMALVAGLCVGFIAIGIAYFVQINMQTQQAKERAQLNQLQAALVSLATQSSQLKSNLDGKADAEALLDQLRSSKLANGSELSNVTDLLNQFLVAVGEQAAVQSGLLEREKALDAAALALDDVVVDPLALAQLRAAEFAYRAQPTTTGYEAVFDNIEMVSRESVINALEVVDGYSAAFEEFAYSLKNAQVLSAREGELERSLNNALVVLAATVNDQVLSTEAAAAELAQLIVAAFIVMVFVIVTATAMGVYFIYKSIVFPMAHIQSVIRRINRGKLKARVKLIENDELGDLGRAFNQLLDERIQNLEEQSLENERLNNSIISLIRAVGTIARKDLTIKVPVSADITGTVSDAINLLTSETAKTLAQVRTISGEVDKVADVLQVQSSAVVRVAEDERKQVIATAKALETSARAMNDIAAKAGDADSLAKEAISSTQQARESVEGAVASILGIRETISETEKRIKRLGDRSQEVSGIVSLINTIAERTHILALNASMHAASAGEAGKGFAVVADEVQRLAENAREATADISSMVNNIRVETSDTVNIMNKLIAEVAAGTKTAELAGRRMNDTDKTTNELVQLVAVMAQSAIRQAEVTSRVRDRAMIIRNFTEKTGSQLGQQKAYTDGLKNQSASLVAQVNLFKLPSELLEAESALLTKAS